MKNLILRLLGYDKDLTYLQLKFDELNEFVDRNCVMTDRNGKSEGDYISSDVLRKYETYYDITQHINNKLRKLRS